MNIYVGNIPFKISEAELQDRFEAHGKVTRVNIVTDRETGRSRGFAFVEMDDDGEARAAIEALDGQEIGGRTVKVNEARPREPREGGGDRPS